MCLKGNTRLGEPLGTVICAYRGGTMWRLLLEMEKILEAIPLKKRPKNIPSRQKPTGVKLVVLEKEQNPPPGSVLLQEVDGVRGGTKFTPKLSVLMQGVLAIEIPLNSSALKPKRQRVTAGMIYSMVWRGSYWRDNADRVHNSPY